MSKPLHPMLWFFVVPLALLSRTLVKAQTPAEALDVPAWQVDVPPNNGPPRMRVVTDAQAHDGEDALTGDAGTGEAQVLSTFVDGPGVFSFWWRSNGQAHVDRLRFNASSLTGLTAPGLEFEITGASPWTQRQVTLPPGRTTLTWTQKRSGLVLPETTGAWLDEFSFTPSGGTVSIAEGVDNGTIVWTVEGDANWRGVSTGADGADYGVFTKATAAMARLHGAMPAGWFSMMVSGDNQIAWPQNIQWGQTEYLNGGWRRYSGRLPLGGDITIQPNGMETIVDECLTLPDNLSAGEAVDAPQFVWSLGPSPDAWGLTRLPHLSSDGVDAAIPLNAGTGWIEGVIPGPGELRVKVKGTSSTTLNGQTLQHSIPNTAWTEQRWALPPGNGTLRWTGGAVDDVRFISWQVVTPQEALETAALTWTGVNAPPGGWYGVNDALAARVGGDLLRAGLGTVGRAATATWSGAGTLRLQWRNRVRLSLDGSLLENTTADWRPLHVEMTDGPHTATFSPGIADDGTGLFEMDGFSWQANASPWRAALENPQGLLAGDGHELWTVAAVASATGGTTLASPALKAGQSARVRFHATGPGTLRFAWRGAPDISSRAALGLMELNGTDTCNIVGETPWKEQAVTLSSGVNFVEWTASPWSSEGCAAGALFLDNVRLESTGVLRPVSVEAVQALGLPGQSFSLSGAANAVVSSPAEAHDEAGALRVEASGTGGSVPIRLETMVPGSFELSFWWKAPAPALHIDGVEWIAPQQPGAAALSVSEWRRAVATIRAPGPHALSFQGTVGNGNALLLDDMTLSAPGAPGTFSAAVGNPALDWAVADLGSGHALPDAATPRGESAGAKLGAGAAAFFRCRTSGPSILSGWWRQDIPGGSLAVSSGFGGQYAAEIKLPRQWRPFRVVAAGTGPQTITLLPLNMSGLPPEAVWLDSLTVEPWRAPTIGEAMGSPELNWSAAPAAMWQSVLSLSAQRVAFNSTVTVPLPELSVTMTGPGFFTGGASGPMNFFLDGVAREKSSFLAIGPGEHTARWTVPGPVTAGAAFLDGPARLLPAGVVPAAQALDLDATSSVSLMSLPAGFAGMVDHLVPLDGEDCGVLPALTSTTAPLELRLSVTGPGRVMFAAATKNSDSLLALELDGQPAGSQQRLTSVNWQWFETPVPAGTHELKLLARRASAAGPEPYLLLDKVRFDSDAPAVSAAGTALDAPGQIWKERAAQPFAIYADASFYGGAAARTGLLAPGDYSWLETDVNGPGMVALKVWDINATTVNSPNATFEATWGSNRRTLTNQTRFRINEPGPQTLRITFQNGNAWAAGSGAWRWLHMDRFVFLPDSAPPVDLGEAVDAPELAWVSAAGHWRGVDMGPYGDMVLAEGGVPAITRTLGFTVPGPGTLSWQWLLDGGSALTLFNPREARVSHTRLGNNNSWVGASRFCLPQQRQWEFRAVNFGATESAQVDHVVWTPATVVPPTEAMETPGRTWTSSAPGAWVGLVLPAGDALSGDDALVTGPLDHNQSAWIETVVTPPAYVSFWWKLSAEAGDVLLFSTDGSTISSLSGSPGNERWNEVSRHLTGTAPVTLRWTYGKNAATHGGMDTAWLDNVVIAAATAGTLPEAANVSGLTLTTGGNAGFSFLPLRTPQALTEGSCAAFFGQSPLQNPPSQKEAWLDGTVTGPGVLTLAWKGSFELLVDGTAVSPTQNDVRFTIERGGWTRVWRQFRDSASHAVRIRCHSPGTLTNPAMVDEIRFDALEPVAAANAPGLTLTTGAVEWNSFGDGTRRYLLAPLITNSASYAEAAITGPALLTFTAGGRGSLVLDGVRVASINGDYNSGAYFGESLFVPPGAHTVRWSCTGSDRLYLSGVGLKPPPDPWLPEVLDAPALWMMSARPDDYARGTDKPLEPGNPFTIWEDADAPLDVFLPAPGILEVSWSPITAVEPAGTPRLSLNPGPAVTNCPAVDEYVTALSSQAIAPGPVRLAVMPWQFTSGDLLRVDRLRFLPAGEVTVAEALDCETMAGVTLQGWRALPDQVLSHDAADAAVADVGPALPPATLSISLQGPVTLTFRWRVLAGAQLSLAVDGVEFANKAATLWRCHRLEIGPGAHNLIWKAPTGATNGTAVLDDFTCTPGAPFLPFVSPHVPALFSECDALAIESINGATGLRLTGATPEMLVPGPAMLETPGIGGTFLAYTGLNRRNLIVPTESPLLQSWPVWPMASVPLAAALDTGLPLNTSGGWSGIGTGDFDFAWLNQPAGAPSQWLETTVQGPGWLTWGVPLAASGETQPPSGLSINGAAVSVPGLLDPGAARLNEAIAYTVRWTASAPASGVRVYGLDHLAWAPDTPEVHPAAWLASFGLTGADTLLTADLDGDGKNNLLEFALGGDPVVPDAARGLTPLLIRRDGLDWPALTFTGRSLSRLRYHLQRQLPPALIHWQPESNTQTAPLTGDGPLFERTLISEQPLPAADTERQPVLLRLEVEWIP